MEIGIIGLPQSGKKTLFNLLTEQHGGNSEQKGGKDSSMGISKVHDERLYALAKIYNPKKVVPATITYILLSKLTKNSEDNRAILKSIAKVDALCHVVRAFNDETVFHIDGHVDAERDIKFLEAELLLNDLIFVEMRLERINLEIKKKNEEPARKEREVLQRILENLNKEIPLRLIKFTPEEEKMISSYPFLTRKNMLVVLNVSENDIKSNELVSKLEKVFEGKGMDFIQVSCKIEMELAEIENDDERKAFLKDLGIERSALEKLTQAGYKSLGLLSFFTVGEDEVRAWTVRNNMSAPQAGGAVHSDIERGFIRAEHMRVEDLIALGSEPKVKEAGKFSLKGKDYLVQDGDILHFRFSV